MAAPAKNIQDRRIQKTQNLLREALASLISEKPYDAIAVKEILDRANVGRSTFYIHFRDKDDLLLSGIHDVIGPIQSPAGSSNKGRDRILWFSLPIFEFHYQHRHKLKVGDKIGTRGRTMLHEHLRKILAEAIEKVSKQEARGLGKASEIPPDLLAGYIASTFVLVLNWWVEGGMRMRPQKINDLFRAFALPTLIALS